MAITTTQQQDLLKLGVGMFNASLGGYIGELAAAVAPATGTGITTAQLYEILANSTAFKSLNFNYGSAATNAQFAAYYASQVLGTSVSAANVTVAATYIQSLLDGGMTRGAVMKTAVDFLAGAAALADTTWGPAAQQFVNKVSVATDYTINQSGQATSLSALQATVVGVTSSAASVTAAIATNSASAGQTFTLTTAADNILGGAGSDTINGANGTTNTFQSADVIDGGGGTDTLNLVVDTGGSFAAATIKNVEIYNIRASVATAIDANLFAGETQINADRATGALTVTNLATGTAIGMIGDTTLTNGAINFAYGTGTSAVAINVSGGTTAGNITNTAGAATTATISSSGAANTTGTILLNNTAGTNTSLTINATTDLTTTLTAADFAATAALTVAGAATKVNVGANGNFKTVDASGLTAGGVIITTGTNLTTLKGGAGADTVTTAAVAATAASAIDAAAGTDILVVAATAHVDTSAEAKVYANFETLDTAAQTVDASLFTTSAISAIRVGGNATFNNLSATQAGAVTYYADAAATLSVKDATLSGNADTLNINTSYPVKAAVTIGNITSPGVETVNLTNSNGATYAVTVSALTGLTGLTNLTLKGDAASWSVTSGALALNVNTVVDGSALTAATTFTFAAATANSLSYKGSSGVDTVTDNVVGGNVLSTGAGKDAITLTPKTSGTAGDVITPGASADTLTINAAYGNDAFQVLTMKYVAGDSVSDGTKTDGYSTSATDNITGIQNGTTAASNAGNKITFDTDVTATAVAAGTTAVVFGTTTVTNAGDFFVYAPATGTDAFIYQDSNSNKVIDSGDFEVKLIGTADKWTPAEFTVSGGNLVYTSIA